MAALDFQVGSTSQLDEIFIQDSSSTTGAGLTGLTSASSGLTCYRSRADDGNAGGTAVSLTSTGTLGTWASGWFKEKDATNEPGVYEIGITNASLATGSRFVVLYFKGATNMAPLVVKYQLTGWNNQDGVHGGMSALPNTACTTNASLITSGTGTDQLSVTSGRIDIGKALGTAVTLDSNNVLNVSTKYIGGTLQTARDIGASVLLAASQHVIVDSGTVTTVTNQLTAAQVATGVWQDTTAGDFTVSASIGKSVMNGVSLGTGLTVNDITTKTGFALTSAYDAAKTAGTSTLTQTQVTGGAYALNSSSFAFASGLDLTTTQKASVTTAATAATPTAAAVTGAVGSVTAGVNVTQVGGTTQTAGDIIAAVGNIAVTSAALNATAASATYTTGTDSGGVANTTTADGVYDSVADSAGTLDFYYQFSLGSTGQTGVGITWLGYVVGVVNTVKVYAYNWGGSAWDQIGTVVGVAGTANESLDWELTSAHTGTGGNLGLVRLRFAATGLTAATVKTDRVLCGFAVVVVYPSNFSSLGIASNGHISNVDTLTTYTGDTPQTGDGYAIVNSGTYGNSALHTQIATVQTTANTINVTTSTNLDTNVGSRMATFTLPTNFSSLTINAGDGGVTVHSYPGNTPQTGDSYPIVNSGSYGNSALLTAIQNVQNNTFIATSIPSLLERPDSGSTTVTITMVFADETGSAKNLDAGQPTITLVNDAGTDLSSRLSNRTNPTTGKYTADYTNTSTDAIEGLHWDVSGTINGKVRRMVAYTQIVDTTAVDFTSTDRTNLGAIKTKTDQLAFTVANQVDSNVITKTGFALISAYDAAKTAAQAGNKMDLIDAPNATAITAIDASVIAIVGSGTYGNAALLTAINSASAPTLAQILAGITSDHGSGLYTDSDQAGTGSRIVTITVNDGTTAIQNARVRIYLDTPDNQVKSTNSSGVVTFGSCGDGTYTVIISYPGYLSIVDDTLVVAGNVTHTYSMTQIAITPSPAGTMTGYTTTYVNGVATANVTLYYKMVMGPIGSGGSFNTNIYPAVNPSSSLLQVTGLVQGATYAFWRGSKVFPTTTVLVPLTGTSFALPDSLGDD